MNLYEFTYEGGKISRNAIFLFPSLSEIVFYWILVIIKD